LRIGGHCWHLISLGDFSVINMCKVRATGLDSDFPAKSLKNRTFDTDGHLTIFRALPEK
jgi:hypothetical protein